MRLEGKRLLFIIAQRNFRDEELDVPKKRLEAEGARVAIASITREEAIGMLGMRVTPDLEVREANPNEYDGLVIVGGTGSPSLADYPEVLDLVRRFVEGGKLVAAICVAPYVLARAGALSGKSVTCWPADFVQAELRRCGAIYKEEGVVRDGNMITAKGPQQADEFAGCLIEALVSE